MALACRSLSGFGQQATAAIDSIVSFGLFAKAGFTQCGSDARPNVCIDSHTIATGHKSLEMGVGDDAFKKRCDQMRCTNCLKK